MFWRRQPQPPQSLDQLYGLSEIEQLETAERLVVAGAWQTDDVDAAIRLARRLDTFVAWSAQPSSEAASHVEQKARGRSRRAA